MEKILLIFVVLIVFVSFGNDAVDGIKSDADTTKTNTSTVISNANTDTSDLAGISTSN
ncbi:hypothetical protein GLW08_20465 [Pontibacillus yanchengensis]|uniref:Uncharacterized protein n=2 Tax=Pontibacillus yanchengensis TaxID=462910 RepID=A0ACC7VMH3_9BACI|nr:hypothetical protein [Pontibacillus yanchengensis]MYL35479.1 hypothetical protein [Pontibacillus yanchengensis]MYL55679.1 hypothetical protein [Pontibacillus yanchengensis]